MQTTGTVLVNGRGINFKGYDCFVNLAKDGKYTTTNASIANYLDAPIAGFDQYIKTTREVTKNSICSLVFSNTGLISYGTYPVPNYPSGPSNFQWTACSWQYMVPLKSESSIPSSYRANVNETNSTCFGVNEYIEFNNTKKIINVDNFNSSGSGAISNVTTNISYDYTSGWHHFAMTCLNKVIRVFIDGKKLFEQTLQTPYAYHGSHTIRGYNQTKYVDDIVVIKDHCLWTSDFTPPTDYLLDDTYNISINNLKKRNVISSELPIPNSIFDDNDLKQY